MRWPDRRSVWRFVIGVVTDPITADLSSSRGLAILFGIVGCIVALKHPGEAATVAALVGGGSVAIATRTKGKKDDADV